MKTKKESLQLEKILKVAGSRFQSGLWSLGNDAFLVIIILILFATFLGEILFYQYIIFVAAESPTPEIPPVHFKENVYQAVQDEWQVRDAIFKNSGATNYQTPFL